MKQKETNVINFSERFVYYFNKMNFQHKWRAERVREASVLAVFRFKNADTDTKKKENH